MVDADVGLQLDKPELRIHVDRDRAADLGVDTTDVATSLRIMVGGDDRVTRYRDAATNEDYDVQLRLDRQYRSDADTISRLYVPSQAGGLVRLDNVVQDRAAAWRRRASSGSTASATCASSRASAPATRSATV